MFKTSRRLAVVLALLFLLPWSGSAHADGVLDWIASVDQATTKVAGIRGDRARAIAWLAAFNALDAIDPRYRPYEPAPAPLGAGSPPASAEAALATALYTVLAAEPDADHSQLVQSLRSSLAAVKSEADREAGAALGRRAALLLLLARAGDPLGRVEPEARETRAGLFVTPSYVKMPRSLAFLRLAPFGIRSVQEFDPGPPPPLGSEAAAREIAEARDLGGMASTGRNGDQTAAALFWNSGDPGDFLVVIKPVLEARKLDALAMVRLVALDAMISVDANIVGGTLKERYFHWRPESAIAGPLAGEGRDASWQPLARTPNSPQYPSGAAIVAGTLEVEFPRLWGTTGPIEWRNSQTSQSRRWPDAVALAGEFSSARVWAGVHFRSAVEAGRRVGRAVATDILDRQLLPR